jgi:Uma2 family endonuclease
MTTAELLGLPDDGIERWLVHGELREKPGRYRNLAHSRATARLGYLLSTWLDHQPAPRGELFSGEVGCRLRRAPDTTVGIDVAYVSAEVAARDSDEHGLIDGPPGLAVEILSPEDTPELMEEKVDAYLEAGVPLVWVVNPYDRTVRVYRPGMEMESFNVTHELSGDPHMPGFKVRVASIFSR